MYIQAKTKRTRTNTKRSMRTVRANEEFDDVQDIEEGMDAADGAVEIDPEASDLLFEAEDVAELVAEVTGEAVEVTVEDDSVTFAVGEDEYTVEAEGNEEILEASRLNLRGKKRVAASTSRRRTGARYNGKPVRRVSASTRR